LVLSLNIYSIVYICIWHYSFSKCIFTFSKLDEWLLKKLWKWIKKRYKSIERAM